LRRETAIRVLGIEFGDSGLAALADRHERQHGVQKRALG
jgi:hypothetical protein